MVVPLDISLHGTDPLLRSMEKRQDSSKWLCGRAILFSISHYHRYQLQLVEDLLKRGKLGRLSEQRYKHSLATVCAPKRSLNNAWQTVQAELAGTCALCYLGDTQDLQATWNNTTRPHFKMWGKTLTKAEKAGEGAWQWREYFSGTHVRQPATACETQPPFLASCTYAHT